MQDFTILATEPYSKTLIEVICSNGQDMDECAKDLEEMGYRGVMTVEVMR